MKDVQTKGLLVSGLIELQTFQQLGFYISSLWTSHQQHRYGMVKALQHRSTYTFLSTRLRTWSLVALVDRARQSNVVTRASRGPLLEAWTRTASCSLAAIVASACVSLAAVEPDPVLDPNNPVVGSKLPLIKP